MERRIATENHRPTSRRKCRSLCTTIALVGATSFLATTQPLHCCYADTTGSGVWQASGTSQSRNLYRQGDTKQRISKRKDDYDYHQQQQPSRKGSSSYSNVGLSFFLRGASFDAVQGRKLGQSTDVENQDDADVKDEYNSQDTVSLGISSAGKSKGGKGSTSPKGSKKGSSTTASSTKSSKSGKNSKSSGKGSNSNDDYVYDDDQYGNGGGDNNNGGSGDNNNGGGDNNNGGGDNNNGGGDNNNGGGDNNNGGGDNNNGGTSSPMPSPTQTPSGGGSGNNEPTGEPTGSTPSIPTSPVVPTEPPDNRGPPTPTPDVPMPTSAPTQPKCPIGADGLFGSQIGLSEEFHFAYQLQVVPSVTVSEINLSVLENIEPAMGERIVARLFDQCAPTSSTTPTESRSIPTNNDPNSFNHQRRWLLPRMLQISQLEGFSIRPRDNVVVEGATPVECVNVEQVYPCYAIRGRVTTYTEQPITDETKARVDSAIQASITAGGLQEADSRVIAVTWRDETTDPLPDGEGGGNNGGSGTPTSAPGGGGNAPTTVPIDREVSSNHVWQPWEISLIAVGGVLVCCMAYLCLRRRSHEPIYDDDDKDEEAEGSNESFKDEPGSKKEKVPLVTPEYQPPQPQQMQSQQPSNDPYRDPYSLPSTRPQAPEEPRDGRRSRASSEGTPIEKASESTEEDEDDDYGDDGEEDDFDDENDEQGGIDPPPSMDLSSQPSAGSRQTAQDNQMLNPYRNGQENQNNSEAQWDEAMFVQSNMPPPESTSEEFSSEYSEEEVDEEYEIEYVEEEEGLEGVDEEYDDEGDEDEIDEGDYDDDEDESYSDDEYDDDEGGEEVVEDEPGKTPILPWLAQDE